MSANVSSRQRLQQHLGPLQVGGVKALGEPAIDQCEPYADVSTRALARPLSSEAERHAQLQGFRLLAAGLGQGLTLVPFGDVDHWRSPRRLGCLEETRAPGLLDPCVLGARQGEGTFDQRPGLFQTARVPVYLSSVRPTLPLRRRD